MMKSPHKLLLLFLLSILSVACRKEPLDIVNPNSINCKTYVQQFETIWEGMNRGYMFWDIDTVDWDARHEQYLPVFQDFDSRKNSVTCEEFQKAYKGLFQGLSDHHLSLSVVSPYDKSIRIENFSPASSEVESRPYYHGYDCNALLDCLKAVPGIEALTTFSQGGEFYTNTFCLLPGKEGSKIAYLHFHNFDFSNNKDLNAPLKAFYGIKFNDGIHNDGWANSNEVSAIIIDLRNNNGGYLNTISPLIGSLLREDVHWGYSRVKEGLGRLDYSAWTKFTLHPHEYHLNKEKPIVVLAGCHSISCAEISTYAIQSLPYGTFIGERTYGATCPLTNVSQQMFYSGTLGDENLTKCNYYIYTSYMRLSNRDYKDFEGIGVTPDIEVPYNTDSIYNYRQDPQLNAALRFLRK